VIYFRSTIRALEDQIAYLKERLAKVEQEKRECEAAARERENALADRARSRDDALLDRLLAKNNVAPVTETPKPAPPDMLTPFGVVDPDVQEAYKESFLREETAHIMARDGCDEGIARAYAEQEYVARYQVIR
jgi:hypothetical protein